MTPEAAPPDALGALVAAFPRLFRERPPRLPSELPPGWAPLVERLFGDIDQALDDEQATKLRVVQIKEKFASLRVYLRMPGLPRGLVARIVELVQAASDESGRTCEVCSQQGEMYGPGWLRTLCREHGEADGLRPFAELARSPHRSPDTGGD